MIICPRFRPEWLFWNGQGTDSSLLPRGRAFAEVSLPILRDMPFAENLTIDAAYRLSNYSSVGETDAWKVGLLFADGLADVPRDDAVRAPNITELYCRSRRRSAPPAIDPCDYENVNEGTPLRVTNCIAAFALGAI